MDVLLRLAKKYANGRFESHKVKSIFKQKKKKRVKT